MKLLSLFDGEGGFPLAGVMNGVEPIAASEIEPYPIAITRSRFPSMKHLGSVTDIDGANIETVDIVTFGSPCTDLSVAGKRAGLQHKELGDEQSTRSGLFFEAVRIIKEMRKATNGKQPRFAVWENVPGAFSSNGGRDFLSVLQALASVAEPAVSIPEPERDGKTDNLIWLCAGSIVGNGFSIAWRTLDAQYWGVPQRRKRIYLVADFGSECATEILFEQTCLRGDFAQSEETRKRIAEDVVGCFDGSNGVECFNPWDSQSMRLYSFNGVHPSVNANSGGGQDRHGVICETLVFNDTQITSPTNGNNPKWNDPCHAIAATDRPPIGIMSSGFIGSQGSKAGSVGFAQELAATLRAGQETHCVIALQANGIDRAENAGCNGAGWREDKSYTLNTVDKHAVVFESNGFAGFKEGCGTLRANGGDIGGGSENIMVEESYPSITGTLSANAGGLNRPAGNCNETDFCIVNKSESDKRYIVRRLMPIETTRLQGYPDGHHDLNPFDGDVDFWESVRKTWAEVNGKQYKPFNSIEKLEKWYNNLRNDASEYKVDGNSLAMPCAEYVIRRIVETVKKESEETT